MAEHGIIFSGEMVRAILAGRKSQSRRVIKPQPPFHGDYAFPSPTVEGAWNFRSAKHTRAGLSNFPLRCPYGKKPGDRLWVRETWAIADTGGRLVDPYLNYRADGKRVPILSRKPSSDWCVNGQCVFASDLARIRPGWHSPVYMPRWASRIRRVLTAIRVERLQEISEEDAIAEGLLSRCGDVHPQITEYSSGDGFWTTKPRTAFLRLWDSINGKKYPWESNPWTWVLEFKVLSDD